MNKRINYIIETTLKTIISEAPAQETDNATADSKDSLFTPAEEKFLGKFDAYGTNQIGIIYSISDTGIREFIARSGKDLNLTPGILLKLLHNSIVKLVPYTGTADDETYTIELQLSLNDVAGLGDEDKKRIEAGSSGGGATPPPAESEPPVPGPENAWFIKYGDILQESVSIIRKLIIESTYKFNKPVNRINENRELTKLPKAYIRHMEQIIKSMDKKTKTPQQTAKIIVEVLNVLHTKMQLSPYEIQKSYDFHKSQKQLQKYLDKNQ
jgi:hypothetical protein